MEEAELGHRRCPYVPFLALTFGSDAGKGDNRCLEQALQGMLSEQRAPRVEEVRRRVNIDATCRPRPDLDPHD